MNTTAMEGVPSARAFTGGRLRQVRSRDIEDHTRQQEDWSQRYDQLDCGSFDGRFIDVRCQSVQIFVEQTNRSVRQRGRLSQGAFGFCVPQARGALWLDGVEVAEPSLLMASENTDVDLCTPAGCTLVGMVVQAQALSDAAHQMDEPPPRFAEGRHQIALAVNTAALTTWRDRVRGVVEQVIERPGLLDLPVVQQQLHDELLLTQLELLASVQPANVAARGNACKRVVDRACELLMSTPDEPLSMLQVCRQVGASPRKLGYCFQNTLGMSPARFIKVTRLNAVRRELAHAQPGQSVYDTAVRWGFWHFGHFSTDYKKQFCESPSDTLRRALSCHSTMPVQQTA